jgi:DNA-binding transcriptional ArsR family regulator
LANAKRIRCLKAVLTEPDITVGEVAEHAAIAENHAGECLRSLQARGLIEARRQSRWVRYRPVPDPLVPSARPLLLALRKALLTEKYAESVVIRTLTAFTHPRRLTILCHLQSVGKVSHEDLVQATSISSPALFRHLAKLASLLLAAISVMLIRKGLFGVWTLMKG